MIWVVSGGWFSSHDSINLDFLRELLNRGYTVFAVVHGSQPKYTIPEAIADMKLAGAIHPQPTRRISRSIRTASASAAARPAGTSR